MNSKKAVKKVAIKKDVVKTAPKKGVIKAARPAAKNIVKKTETATEKKPAPAKKWQKVQTAEGWKRSMLKMRKADKTK